MSRMKLGNKLLKSFSILFIVATPRRRKGGGENRLKGRKSGEKKIV